MLPESPMPPLLRYDAVSLAYGDTSVVREVSFSLRAGEILGIVGESGSGKSTLLKAALHLNQSGARWLGGDIQFQGASLRAMSPAARRRIAGAKIGTVFQDAGAYFCPTRTLGSQFLDALRAHEKITSTAALARVSALLDTLGFADSQRILQSYVFELSGGMVQRVGIAMAMLLKPPVLLADEPTSALDVLVQRQIVDALLALRQQYGTALILISHNIGLVAALADHVGILKDGALVEYGQTAEVLGQPQHAYTRALLAAWPGRRSA